MIRATLVSAVLALALVASLSSATPVDFLIELGSSTMHELEDYAKQLDELNDALKAQLPQNEDPKANMDVVVRIADSLSPEVSHYSKYEAIKLIASLETDAYECDDKSFRVLARGLAAVQSMELNQGKANTRLRAIADHYHKQHALHCNAHYLEEFERKREQLTSLSRVEAAFKDVSRYDFNWLQRYHEVPDYSIPDENRRLFVLMELDPLSQKPVPEASKKIVENIIGQVGENPKVDQKLDPSFVGKVQEILDEYLFKPCADYEKILGDDLSAARLDALIEDEGLEFMADRQTLYQGIVYDRLCKAVIREKSLLQVKLVELWHEKAVEHL